MKMRLKIRGIYTTALTKFLLGSGYALAQPSVEIQERFGLKPNEKVPDISIQDRHDLQGIDIIGEADQISPLVRLMQERFIDATLLDFVTKEESGEESEEAKEIARARLELGGASKEALDRIRSSVVPTLARHHRLRIIHPKKLERAEKQLLALPKKKEKLEQEIFLEMVLEPLKKAGLIKLEHIKASGKPIRPREGILVDASAEKILVKRLFSQGRYDGLNLPIEKGDYGLTEVQEGAWYIKHAYYSAGGKLKGEYYNINTPVELYPTGARYLDLEVDVVRRVGEKSSIVDRETLAILAKKGLIGSSLKKRALEVAERLKEELNHPSASS